MLLSKQVKIRWGRMLAIALGVFLGLLFADWLR